MNRINSELPSNKKVIAEAEELMEQMIDEGGELIGYFANENIQKMEPQIGLI